jgi:hypothetical protein
MKRTVNQQVILQAEWKVAPAALLPAVCESSCESEYTFVFHPTCEVITMRRCGYGSNVPTIVSRRAATLAEAGMPWADTYIGHPDKPCGTLTDRNWGGQIYVGDMTKAQFKQLCRSVLVGAK